MASAFPEIGDQLEELRAAASYEFGEEQFGRAIDQALAHLPVA
jgi:hypothetical protein